MKTRVVACAVLVCLASDASRAGVTRGKVTSRLFVDVSRSSADVVSRPRASIPYARPDQQAVFPPMPRARPSSAPAARATATVAPALPPNHPTAAAFPPVVTFE